MGATSFMHEVGPEFGMALQITNIVESARQTLAPVGNTLSDTWAALIGDRVAAWRVKNAAAIQMAVDGEVKALGLKIDRAKIPERYAMTWFEEATKQDEPEIHQLFARLLARAAAGDEDAADRRHLEVLTHFTPKDAQVFHWYFAREAEGRQTFLAEHGVWADVRNELGNDSWMSIEHLLALGVLERRFDVVSREGGFMGRDEWAASADLTSTERGMSLYRACKPAAAEE
ncbi:MAG: hypothetical protein EOP61_21985 [Sphingomonadales bacterium]|nr:MAG: hypothetical protein EOP61_21985 [Sphingomonadales bacterium]